MLEPCEKHELIGCQDCNRPSRPTPRAEADSVPIRARYDGQCPECDLAIIAGKSMIVLRRRTWGNSAVHQHCA